MMCSLLTLIVGALVLDEPVWPSVVPEFMDHAAVCATTKRAQAACDFNRSVTARVEVVDGVPRLSVNGERFDLFWGSLDRNRRPDKLPRLADAGFNAVTVMNVDTEDWNPSLGKFDFTVFDRRAEEYGRENPNAYFIWDLSLYPPRDWARAHPEDLSVNENGKVVNDRGLVAFSFASENALSVLRDQMERALAYLEASPYANRILGYRINSGHTIEWLNWEPGIDHVLDFSPVATNAFRKFAAKHYPRLVFTGVPTFSERHGDGRLLWNAGEGLNAVAYWDFYSQAIADGLIGLCRRAKELLGGRKLVGTYYGYTMTLGDSGISHMRGHYALKKVLDANAVDFLMSPPAYYIRQLGGTVCDMKPYASLAAHGIIPIVEDDTRTHNGPYLERSNYWQTLTENQSLSVLRRNLSIALCRNEPMYLYSLILGTETAFPAFEREGRTLSALSRHCQLRGVGRHAEVAVVVSEANVRSLPMSRTFRVATGYEAQKYNGRGEVERYELRNTPLTGETFEGNHSRCFRAGAPVDFVLAEDLCDNPGAYKLYIFANQYGYDDRFLEAVRRLRERECTLCWLYAPGYSYGGTNSVENMRRLTGMEFAELPGRGAVRLTMSGDGRKMGVEEPAVSPRFSVANPTRAYGLYETGEVGAAEVRVGKSKAVFSGSWQLDVRFFQDLFRSSGVHVYTDTSDPVEANDSLFTLHARFPGRKRVRLPRRASVVDVVSGKVLCRDSDAFEFDAPLHSTWLFYFGDDAEDLLKKLGK